MENSFPWYQFIGGLGTLVAIIYAIRYMIKMDTAYKQAQETTAFNYLQRMVSTLKPTIENFKIITLEFEKISFSQEKDTQIAILYDFFLERFASLKEAQGEMNKFKGMHFKTKIENMIKLENDRLKHNESERIKPKDLHDFEKIITQEKEIKIRIDVLYSVLINCFDEQKDEVKVERKRRVRKVKEEVIS